MAKKIQKKQIEDGVFVETKSTYSAPTQDNEFVQKKYVDEEVAKKADASHTHSWTDITNKPRISVTLADTAISRTYTIGLTGANGSSGKLVIPKAVSGNDVTDKPTFPTLPSWVTQTKPTYDWTEIQNKPEIDKKVRYERVSDLNTLLTEKGILKVADGDNVEGAPVKGSNVWWHFIAGSHLNSLDWQYYLAFPLAIESSDFWFKQKLATQDKSWVKFSGLSQLNGNGLFREWNLEHGLSTYIGNSNVFNVRTGVSGGASDLLFGVQNDKVVVPTYLESANELKGSELWLDTDKNGNVTRFRANNDTLTIGNKEWNDLKYLHTKGIKIWGHTDDNKVVLAGGGTKNLSDFDFYKGRIEPNDLNVFQSRKTGVYAVKYPAGWGTLVNFKSEGSTSSIEFLKRNWYPSSRIGVRNSVDDARFNEDNGEFRDLAWYNDILRTGVECTQNTTLQKEHQNQTLFVTVPCNIELNTIDDLSSVSFRKVFDNGVVTFTCTGKNIIYTSDNQFNGKKGSTAVISRYGNDCYIDIRNV